FATFAHDSSNTAKVSVELTVLDKFGEDSLRKDGRVAISNRFGEYERLDKLLWQDDVSEPQRGKEHFGEGADVNDPAIRIQSLKRFLRSTIVAKFAVVIVFKDEGTGFPGEGGEHKAPLEGHYAPGWILMRRGHAYQPDRLDNVEQIFDDQPVI